MSRSQRGRKRPLSSEMCFRRRRYALCSPSVTLCTQQHEGRHGSKVTFRHMGSTTTFRAYDRVRIGQHMCMGHQGRPVRLDLQAFRGVCLFTLRELCSIILSSWLRLTWICTSVDPTCHVTMHDNRQHSVSAQTLS